jgi:hypothetical protein
LGIFQIPNKTPMDSVKETNTGEVLLFIDYLTSKGNHESEIAENIKH